ncbi:hypothetical protein ACSHWB_17220 [Lentzea sp. HUAS TT2]|uniref:hypothetical protein n=1 Tax=Lentzea sp. HUAS TT2 TaxID=3447454 RepID=UPI003F72F9DC
MLTRVVMGLVAGAVAVLGTGLACVVLYAGFCGFSKPAPWSGERCLMGDYAELGLWLVPVVLLGGLSGSALLHGWLLKVCRQPQPYSVVVPGIALFFVLLLFGWVTGVVGLVLVPAVAFALAGAATSRSAPGGAAARSS